MTDEQLNTWCINRIPLQVIHTKGECLNVQLVRFTQHAIFLVAVGLLSPVGMLLRVNVLAILELADDLN